MAGAPSTPVHRAMSLAKLSLALSIASPRSLYPRPDVNRPVTKHPGGGGPVPVAADESDIQTVLGIEPMLVKPGLHDDELGDAREQVRQVRAQNHPDDRAVSVVVPAELQRRGSQLEETHRDQRGADGDHD